MKTGKQLSIINRIFLFIFVFLLSSINSFALDNSLSGINVSQNENNEYKVLLKLDKNVQIKKISDEQDTLILVLSSTLPSDSMEIVYDNARDLNNVIVQKKNADNTLILLQGKNIENAKIYTKDLSVGIIKPFDTNSNSSGNLFFIADKKVLAFSLTGLIILFLIMLASRPGEKRYQSNNINRTAKSVKRTEVNTLRNKNLVQSRNIPSINYRSNGSFNSANAFISTPEDFAVNNGQYSEEKIRKAG